MKHRRTRSRKKPAKRSRPSRAVKPTQDPKSAKEPEPAAESDALSMLFDSERREELSERLNQRQLKSEDREMLLALLDFRCRLVELVGPEGLTKEGLRKLVIRMSESEQSADGVADNRVNLQTPYHGDITSGIDA